MTYSRTWAFDVSRKKSRSRPVPTPEPRPRLDPVRSVRFNKDVARQKARGKDMSKLHAVIVALSNRQPLDPKHRDHALTGNLTGFRDCHIEPDWILIYERTETELRLMRTGTHSDLDL